MTSTAEAKKKIASCSYKQPATSELMCGRVKLHHANSLIRFLKTNTTAGTRHVRERLWKDGLWLRKYAQHHIQVATQRLLPPHYKGWICIHNGEASWYDKGAPYFGGLQMSYGWADRVTDASLLSPLQQMWAAENEAAEHGFTYSWMHGQWPNTFPPCSRFF